MYLNYFIFEVLKKKNLANFQRKIELCIQKIVTKLSKICINIPDPGVKKAPDPESRIRNTGTPTHKRKKSPEGH